MIDNKIESCFEQYIEDLKLLIQHRSVYETHEQYAFGEAIYLALKEFSGIAKKFGFTTYVDPKGRYAYADIGEGDSMFGVLGHLDVVPEGDLSLWKSKPYELHNNGEALVARGVADDKGPVLTSLYALKLLLDEGHQLKSRVRFIIGGDEESLWRCMDAYRELEEIPDLGFTPDARFPLIYAEKGLIQFNLHDDSQSVCSVQGGAAYNAVSDTATITYSQELVDVLDQTNIEYLHEGDKLIIKGKASHAMAADKGINANVLAAIALHKLGNQEAIVSFLAEKGLQANGDYIFGILEDDISGKLMFNPAIVKDNMLGIDIRYPVTVSKDVIVEKMNEVAKQYNLRIEEYDYLRSIHMDQSSDFIQTLMKVYQDETGDLTSLPISSGGATYARAMDNVVAFGPGFVDHPQFEHEANEQVLISDIKLAMRIYYSAFKALV